MPHYFSEDNNNIKSNPKVIAFRVNETALKFHTDHGVFSKDNLDRGTEVLLKFMEVHPSHKTGLDLGCGYGVIGIYLQKAYNLDVDLVDINQRALDLTTMNIDFNNVKGHVYKSNGFEDITSSFDVIVLNPPIRTGKEVIYKMFEDSINYLNDNGEFFIVINKKHGAKSAIAKLESIYNSVEIVGKDKGFFVIKSKK